MMVDKTLDIIEFSSPQTDLLMWFQSKSYQSILVDFVWAWFGFLFFETGSHYVVLTGMNLR